MVIIARSAITSFCLIHPDATDALLRWYMVTSEADWNNFNELKSTYSSADFIGNDRFVFNIKGNNYRLIALLFFNTRTVFIRFIGTHSEYDKINAKAI